MLNVARQEGIEERLNRELLPVTDIDATSVTEHTEWVKPESFL